MRRTPALKAKVPPAAGCSSEDALGARCRKDRTGARPSELRSWRRDEDCADACYTEARVASSRTWRPAREGWNREVEVSQRLGRGS